MHSFKTSIENHPFTNRQHLKAPTLRFQFIIPNTSGIHKSDIGMRLRTDKLHRSPSKCRTRPLITTEPGTSRSRESSRDSRVPVFRRRDNYLRLAAPTFQKLPWLIDHLCHAGNFLICGRVCVAGKHCARSDFFRLSKETKIWGDFQRSFGRCFVIRMELNGWCLLGFVSYIIKSYVFVE